MGTDPHALNGKLPAPEQSFEVVVIGAGPAGSTAAIAAARQGARVLLVDENPVSAGLMGLDTPLYFGGRMTGAVQRKDRMLEQVFAANPALEEALDLGVELALGAYCWGAYVNGPALQTLPQPMVGLADEDRAWMVGFGKLILAAGARDLPLAFPGWDQPGIMGANGLAMLLQRYDAFSGRRLVILGSGDLGLQTALLALDHGLEVAAIVEVLEVAQGSQTLLQAIAARGVPILTGQVIHRANGGRDGVERIEVGPSQGPIEEIACDTVCLAIGLVPAIDLFSVLGGQVVVDDLRGGHIPHLDVGMATSLPSVAVTGDCAGLGVGVTSAAYQMAWMTALLSVGGDDVVVCQCEEVSRKDILSVQPPSYLQRPPKMAARDLEALSQDGPINQDQIKRLTRAGMGACQGRRCREQVGLTLACASGCQPQQIPLPTYRTPVRPLPLKVLADWDEAPAMGVGWDVWFGIPSQWLPYRHIDSATAPAHLAIISGAVAFKP